MPNFIGQGRRGDAQLPEQTRVLVVGFFCQAKILGPLRVAK